MPGSVTEAVDGRVGRAARSRAAICDACLDLVQEGVLRPSADQIAERAGLSRRSIFYHFADLGELYDAVVEAGIARCAPLLKEIPREIAVSNRIEQLIGARSKFFEATAPFTRALTAQSLMGPASEQARRVALEALDLQKRDIERLLGDELEGLSREARVEAIEAMSAATAAPAWEYLRRSRGLSLPKARDVMKRTVRALLRDAGVRIP
jgi:AcrR family transcriptional regulator